MPRYTYDTAVTVMAKSRNHALVVLGIALKHPIVVGHTPKQPPTDLGDGQFSVVTVITTTSAARRGRTLEDVLGGVGNGVVAWTNDDPVRVQALR